MPSYFVTETSQNTFVPSLDWEEDYAMDQPGGGASFSRDSGEASLQGKIPFNKCRSARNVILGYAWADAASPWALHRTVPWRHPMFPEMRATDVHFQGFNPMANPANLNNKPYLPAAVPTSDITRMQNYSRATTTVRFKPHPYLFLTDTELGGYSEMSRSCTIFDTLDPSLELLLAATEPFLTFIEGPLVGTATADFPGAIPEYIAKCLFVIAWFDVPMEFIANPYLPSKIMQCIGYLNGTDDWLNGGIPGNGFPKGTLLLEAPRIRKKLQPIWTINDRSPAVCDIFFPFKFFNPTAAVSTPLLRGWNLFPFARTGRYYSVGRKDDTSQPFLGFKNFDACWTHCLGPVLP